MPTIQEAVRVMCRAYGHDVHDTPRLPSPDVQALRQKLVTEEYSELMLAIKSGNLVDILAEASDMIVVLHGLAAAYGGDLDAFTRETLRANMDKVLPDGALIKDSDGKVLKPEGWRPADYSHILGDWTPQEDQ